MACIRVYQATLSPDHGPFKHRYSEGYCRFTPTCSEYGHEAIEKFGLFRGGCMAAWRILRCNPCSRAGYDPVRGGKKGAAESGKETTF